LRITPKNTAFLTKLNYNPNLYPFSLFHQADSHAHRSKKYSVIIGLFLKNPGAFKADISNKRMVYGRLNISAIDVLIKRVWKCFTIQIIPATFPGLRIIAGFGKLCGSGRIFFGLVEKVV
jgi:hypothetical protein